MPKADYSVVPVPLADGTSHIRVEGPHGFWAGRGADPAGAAADLITTMADELDRLTRFRHSIESASRKYHEDGRSS